MINQRVSCISVDIINADKPAAGLAFLAGACEMAKVDYDCVSINSTLLDKLTQENFNQIYAARDSSFANARTVRNIFEACIKFQARRTSPLIGKVLNTDLSTIDEQDIKNVIERS